jgi:hypothetical protein
MTAKRPGPPAGEPWAWETLDFLRSPAMAGASINLLRLLRFLKVEHLQHCGRENGCLLAPYDQLVLFGITRRLIPATIKEGVERGLVRVQARGRGGRGTQLPSLYRITFLPAFGEPPTDEWRQYVLPPSVRPPCRPASRHREGGSVSIC